MVRRNSTTRGKFDSLVCDDSRACQPPKIPQLGNVMVQPLPGICRWQAQIYSCSTRHESRCLSDKVLLPWTDLARNNKEGGHEGMA